LCQYLLLQRIPQQVVLFWKLGSGMAAKGYFWKAHEPYIGEHGIRLILQDAFLVGRLDQLVIKLLIS